VLFGKKYKILKSGGKQYDQHEKQIAATLMTTTLAIGLTIPAMAMEYPPIW